MIDQASRALRLRIRDLLIAVIPLGIYHMAVVGNLHSSILINNNNHAPATASPGTKATQLRAPDRASKRRKPTKTKQKTQAYRPHHPSGPPPLLTEKHTVMKRAGSWSPIVMEETNLLFFDVPKVGSTGFKQLFLRMLGNGLWNETDVDRLHFYGNKALKTLDEYPLDVAQRMMTSPNWTRAIFVRDPKERLLSAFLDKVIRVRGVYVGRACCKQFHYDRDKNEKKWGASRREIECMYKAWSFEGFLEITATSCSDEQHWRPQSVRVDDDLFDYINFVGYMDSIASDTRLLLESLGGSVWEEFGASGWGSSGTASIFERMDSTNHHADSGSQYDTYFTPELERKADEWLKDEYSHRVLKLPRRDHY